MALHLIYGNSGSGKSYRLNEKILQEGSANLKKRYFIIVPEQFTMSTQRALVMQSEHMAIMNVEVISFNRLAYRIFEELGTEVVDILDDTGKNLLLAHVAQTHADQLTVLRRNLTHPGTIADLKSLISELMQYDITPEEFEKDLQLEGISASFRRKGQDILTMYRGFLEEMGEHFISAEHLLQLFADVVPESAILQDAVFALDGFTGFTPIQIKLLSALMKKSSDFYATVTWDAENQAPLGQNLEESDLFAMSSVMTEILTRLAGENGLEITSEVIPMNGNSRFQEKGQLAFLEKHIFRNDGAAYAMDAPCEDSIRTARLMNAKMELEYAAAQIRKGILEGHHFRDYAIVCANLGDYRHYVPEIFTEYEIPYFLDAKAEVAFHPLIETIESIYEMAEYDFNYDSVIRFLRSGMSPLDPEEIDALDNYLRASGYRGYGVYTKNFRRKPRGVNPDQLACANEYRKILMEPFGDFFEKCKKTVSVQEHCTNLLELLDRLKIRDRLEERALFFEATEPVRSQQYKQIYEMTVQLTEKLNCLLGQREMAVEEFHRILSAGFAEMKIGTIPPTMDAVLIGDITRSRLENVTDLFFLGASDDNIPMSTGRGGLLSPMERQRLAEQNVELAPTQRQQAFQQRYYLYLLLTKPTCHLMVTYPRMNNSGKSVRASYLIEELKKLFGDRLEQADYDRIPADLKYATADSMKALLADQLREYMAEEEKNRQILSNLLAFYQCHPCDDIRPIYDAAAAKERRERIAANLWKQIFDCSGSVSRFENYAKCPYSYFLNYVLRLRERTVRDRSFSDYGTVYHEALKNYGQMLKDKSLSWTELTAEERNQYVANAVQQAIEDTDHDEYFEEAANRFVASQITEMLQKTVWGLTEQLKAGSFMPSRFEVDFREIDSPEELSIQLDEMHQLRLSGKVDRIDTLETEDAVYVKIIDYKSTGKDVDFGLLYSGIQIQLVMYMNAALAGMQKEHPDQEVLPGAMFYYTIQDPLFEPKKEKDPEELALEKMKASGLVNQDPQVILGLDQQLESGASLIAPFSVSELGVAKDARAVVSAEDMLLMGEFVKHKITSMAQSLDGGYIEARPYKSGQKTGCDYCSFRSVCQFDSHGVNKFQHVDSLKKEYALLLMEEDLYGKRMDQ